MAPAYRDTPKGVIIQKTGARLNMGQLFPPKQEKPKMFKNTRLGSASRDANGDKIGRDGRVAKRIDDAAPVKGQRSRIAPAHDFLHGAPVLNDEPNAPLAPKSHEAPIKIHDGMSAKSKAKVDPDAASKQFDAAANLGRKA